MNTFLDEQPPNLALRRVGKTEICFFLKERALQVGNFRLADWHVAGVVVKETRLDLFFFFSSLLIPFPSSSPALFSAPLQRRSTTSFVSLYTNKLSHSFTSATLLPVSYRCPHEVPRCPFSLCFTGPCSIRKSTLPFRTRPLK